MKTITLVTGNAGKLKEWQRLFPAEYELRSKDIDLDEIQSIDLEKIALDKAKRAFEVIGGPVLVEDVSAGLLKLGGLPGPFIKYFELSMGADALFRLVENGDNSAIVTCVVGYYDGRTGLTTRGEVRGKAVAARGENGFGFDMCFMPDGQSKTFGEMIPIEKDAISHRSLAIKDLLQQLETLSDS